jgi:hypothetical protein
MCRGPTRAWPGFVTVTYQYYTGTLFVVRTSLGLRGNFCGSYELKVTPVD